MTLKSSQRCNQNPAKTRNENTYANSQPLQAVTYFPKGLRPRHPPSL